MTLQTSIQQFTEEKARLETKLNAMERCGVKDLLETYPELESAFKELNLEAKIAVFTEVIKTLSAVE